MISSAWQKLKQYAYEFDFADSKVITALFVWNIFETFYLTNYFSKRAAARAAKMVRYEAREEIKKRRGPKKKGK